MSTKTNALHNACEHLLADQTALINTADAIQENLEFFIEYERIHAVSGIILFLAIEMLSKLF